MFLEFQIEIYNWKL